MKPKHPKFQESKPSYLLSGIVSKLLLEIDKKLLHNNVSKYQNTFSPFQKPTPLNIIFQDKLICANIGDSRTVLSRLENSSYSTLVLSRDQKPTEQDECERIKKH